MAAPGGVAGLAGSVLDRADFPAGPLVVALSGGADSAVLAWAATRHTGVVRAVFADHGLPASPLLRRAAAEIAAHLEFALDVVAAPVDPEGPSHEDAARAARYAALVAAAKPDEWIVTGHTADDQAETVLGNVLRGAGPDGLAGIPARRRPIARPLLAVTRAETRELAAGLGLPFRDDPGNADRSVRRNRLRLDLIPRLEAGFNPQLRTALQRTARVLQADAAVLDQAAGVIPVRGDGEVVTLPAPLLAAVPPALATRAIRRALRAARGPYAGSYEEVTAVLRVALREQTGAELAGGWRVEREGPMVVLSAGRREPANPVPVGLPASVAFDRWTVVLDLAPAPPPAIGATTLAADADVVGEGLELRPAAPADRIEIGTGSKPVGDALAEAGVPRRLRLRWPVLAAGNRIALIPGVRVAAWAWRGAGTTRYLVARIDGPVGETAWSDSETY